MPFRPMLIMYTSIQFYAKIQRVTEKIKNIGPNRMLATEAIPRLAISQIAP